MFKLPNPFPFPFPFPFPSPRLSAVSVALGWGLYLASGVVHAQSNDAELISMPTGRLLADGRVVFSLGRTKAINKLDIELAAWPWLQVGLGIVQYNGTQAFDPKGIFTDYGSYKDKTSVLRVKLAQESFWMPSVVFSAYDLEGTGLLRANALAASKRIGDLDLSLGTGNRRLNGHWLGANYTPSQFPRWSMLAERDVIDYSKSAGLGGGGTNSAGIPNSRQPIAVGLRYAGDGYAVAVSRKYQQTEVKLSTALDLQRPAWGSVKSEDPLRSALRFARPSAADWQNRAQHRKLLNKALAEQGFAAVSHNHASGVFTLALTHASALRASQAAGRAAQVVLALGPADVKTIRVRYHDPETRLPAAEFEFNNLEAWQRYWIGDAPKATVASSVTVKHLFGDSKDQALAVDGSIERGWVFEAAPFTAQSDTGIGLSLARPGFSAGLSPKLSAYLNGPAAFQYGIKLQLDASWRVAAHTVASAVLTQTLKENFSSYPANVSRSDLPKVRSDFYRYEEGSNAKLERLLINHFMKPAHNQYTRVSAGIYELAFGGVGAQWLYAEPDAPWSVDVSVDAVRQRSPGKAFGFDGYRSTTALLAWHQELGDGLVATARMGRFLAGDKGVRFEAKRRFESGVEAGAWFSVTDAKDFGVTAGKNYRDKGVFVTVPFDSLLNRSSREVVTMALSPWTRDIAQMVTPAADLRTMFEAQRRNLGQGLGQERGKARLADVDDDKDLRPAPGLFKRAAVLSEGPASILRAGAGIALPVVDALSLVAGADGSRYANPIQGLPCKVTDTELSGQYTGPCNPQGLAHGKGFAKGTVASYSGEFVNGKKHGKGVKRWLLTGDSYEGEFENDFRHGLGDYLWGKDSGNFGGRYVGAFAQDKREGQGTFTWPNGDQYSGPWRQDQQIGPLTPMQQIQRAQQAAINREAKK